MKEASERESIPIKMIEMMSVSNSKVFINSWKLGMKYSDLLKSLIPYTGNNVRLYWHTIFTNYFSRYGMDDNFLTLFDNYQSDNFS